MARLDFRTIAQTDAHRILHDVDNQRLTAKTGFFKGLRCKLQTSTTAEKSQNKAVMRAFKQYLKTTYGRTVSESAFKPVRSRFNSGKALSSGNVKQVLHLAERSKRGMQTRNLRNAHFSLQSGSLQSILNREIGNSRRARLPKSLERLVKRAVHQHPQTGKKVLSRRDLKQIAVQALGEFQRTLGEKQLEIGSDSYGLKEVLSPQQFSSNRYISRSGIDYLEDTGQLQQQTGIHRGKTRIGRYLYLQDKKKGVEPGFEAVKNWSLGDSQKLLDSGHGMFTQAGEFIDCHLNSSEPVLSHESLLKETALGFIRRQMKPISMNPQFNSENFSDAQDNLTTFLGQHEGLKNSIKTHIVTNMIRLKEKALLFIAQTAPDVLEGKFTSQVIEQLKTGTITVDSLELLHFKFDSLVDDDSELKTALHTHLKTERSTGSIIRNHIQSSRQKFLKKHYVKLDYKEANHRHRWGFGERLEQISRPRNKGIFHRMFKSRGIFHKFFTAHTRKEANHSAIMECMANDLMRTMGITTQKMKLIPTEYRDGGTKLLLDGTHMQGQDQGISSSIESFRDFSGRIVDGFMCVRQGDDLVSDSSINDLGKFKIFMLLLADRDSIGSRGDNKGAIGNEFSAIDPGHSLEEQMTSRTLNSDFSFESPKGGTFKNFTVFDDRPYSEKMAGIQQLLILTETDEDLRVFNDYSGIFDGSTDKALSFSQEIEQKKIDYQERRDYILEKVFGERIAFLGGDHHPKVLDCLDGLEKLTSQTSDVSENGNVHLRYPRVVQRTEWHIAQNVETDDYQLTCNPGNDMVEQVERIKTFLTTVSGLDLDDFELSSSQEHGIKLTLSPEKMGQFAEGFSLEQVMLSKHPNALEITVD